MMTAVVLIAAALLILTGIVCAVCIRMALEAEAIVRGRDE